MLKGESGIHPYVIIKGPFNGEMRTMYRFDMSLLDWTWTPERVGQQKSYAYLQGISQIGNLGDETWRLPDNSVYSKYDWCLYYSERTDVGTFRPRGFGAFFHSGQRREAYASRAVGRQVNSRCTRTALDLELPRWRTFQRRRDGGRAERRKNVRPVVCLFQHRHDNERAIISDALKTAVAEDKKMAVSVGRRTALSG